MTTQITTVVFDVGHVLIDWNARYLYRKIFGVDEAGMERFLAEVCTEEWDARFDTGRTFAEGLAELFAAHPDQVEPISAYDSRWPEMLGDVFDGTVAILAELRRAGLRTYVLSNWSSEKFPDVRSRLPILDEMDGILISAEVGVAKPDPAIFREFFARFDLIPQDCVFVDDRQRNVDVAAELGMVAVRFIDPDRLRSDLRLLGLPLAAESPAAQSPAASGQASC